MFFVTFVLFAQFVLVNIVIAVLMKHLRIPEEKVKEQKEKLKRETQKEVVDSKKENVTKRDDSIERTAFLKWHGKVCYSYSL